MLRQVRCGFLDLHATHEMVHWAASWPGAVRGCGDPRSLLLGISCGRVVGRSHMAMDCWVRAGGLQEGRAGRNVQGHTFVQHGVNGQLQSIASSARTPCKM
eukprot:3540937-Alexandrium_andersonii.AAC.1